MPQQRLPMRRLTQLWLAHAHIIPIVSTRAPPNTCPFPRFRSLEVFRRRPLAVWDVCDGRHLKTFTGAVISEASAGWVLSSVRWKSRVGGDTAQQVKRHDERFVVFRRLRKVL